MLLIVIEDHHAERALRDALASARDRQAKTVVTADALLAMRLRRDGVAVRLTTDGLTLEKMRERDRIALDGVEAAFRATGHDP